MPSITFRSLLLPVALALPGCGPGAGETDATATTATTATAETSGPTSSSTGPGGSTTETTDPTTGDGSTSAGPTTGGPSTGVDETSLGTTVSVETTAGETTVDETTMAGTTAAETTLAETAADETTDGCADCDITLMTDRSTTLVPTANNTLLGVVSQSDAIVWAIDTVESGRVAYAGTADMLNNEGPACGLWAWLAATDATPRVLATGNFRCDAQRWNGLGELDDFTFASDLPAQYVGDPAALRADFDVVIFCVNNFGGPNPIDAQTYVDYVTQHGGGLYLAGSPVLDMPSEDIDRINEIAVPLGVEFQAVDLDWAPQVSSGGFACFPEQAP
jgi:hypothetical protein